MTIRVAVRHSTHYGYDRRIQLGPQVVRLRPAPHARTHIASFAFKVEPKAHFLNWQQDPQGNFLARLVFPEPTDHFRIDVEVTADLRVVNPFDFFLEPEVEQVPFAYDEATARELRPYLEVAEVGPRFDALVAELRPAQKQRTVDYLVLLNQVIQKRVDYVIRLEPGVQTPDQTLELGRGSCRDSAWLVVQLLRRLGLAARFASGYLVQLRADEKPIEGPAGPESDFTDLHAWAEVYLPGAGWIGLDATSGLLTGEGHIPLACTPDPSSAAPVSGELETCEVKFEHTMTVERVLETPRVTLPYTEAAWSRIEALGHDIDARLRSADVRMTMGGEPTFVSIDDRDGVEWNFGALGTHKRSVAGVLFRKLARRFAKDPLLHYGQGKWYPGESLPRWALACYFRKDGDSIWRAEDLIAEDGRDYAVGPEKARRFIERLANNLELSAANVLPGYEDPFQLLLSERKLPVNVTPSDNRLADPLERARISRLFEQGLGKVVGYALPLAPAGFGRWRSSRWFLRRERLLLLPGDSPMGYRLPLDSLPWVSEADFPYVHERDPFAAVDALPPYNPEPHDHLDMRLPSALPGYRGSEGIAATEWRRQSAIRASRAAGDEAVAGPHGDEDRPPAPFESAASSVRSTLCVEPREGILNVFMPPLGHIEDYLNLVHHIELVARELGQPVRIEGYAPPQDVRVEKFSVTPDPGVIEVNVHPAASWTQLVAINNGLYDDARESRLGTEKFLIDGRPTGTGGGNHLTLGSTTPADSPFLRRPELLGSLIGYWHDHPSLSYLFSGLFIGPTSQAPRVDEARHEASYELETAINEARRVSAGGAPVPPWWVDRIFRNLLADVTGNTHRTEFCIDKLYSPDSATGRNGLLEMRAFEMPPHSRMSLTQMLLVRALVSRFWDRPYRSKVVRWGTSLHDKFMLPHFVWQDFREVLDELRAADYPFEDAWFAPHMEFRFPHVGSVNQDGVELELRRALEPWHVLAEEATGSGVLRHVDSSLERVQLLVRNAVPGRHVVTCRGARAPLHPTGTRGEFVAGVRFRAWQLPSQLHPTIGVHAPIELSLVDSWSGRVLGACVLHVSHPGGLSDEKLPVNAFEAEARRQMLFASFGPTGGRVDVSRMRELANPDYPLTLDLRRLNLGEPAA
ncbi:MAG TPA: transglutaminase family protein [Polyangiaceae bacterium]|nr:transglutaminase family protein [Polyangiaceae bacterium]